MTTYLYKKIDAFTSGNSLGNPAACLYLRDGQMLTDDELLSVACAHKGFVSEVVCCSQNDDLSYNLRYFSSACEVDFCGHGTIACMAGLIEDNADLLDSDEIVIHTKHSMLTVYIRMKTQNSVFISAPNPRYLPFDIDYEDVATALGMGTEEIDAAYPVEMINAGLYTLIVPTTNLTTESNLFPDVERLKAFCLSSGADIVLIFSKEVKNGANIAHTRVFAPKFGYLEDPATGSGNSAFGYYMLKHGLWDGSDCSVEQGGSDRVYNVVRLATVDGKVMFGGGATTRIRGDYYLEG